MKLGNQFAGKIAVVTGGGAGLGAAFCRALAASGAKVIVADIRGALAQEVASAIGGEPAEVDVSNPEQITGLLESIKASYGSLDVVINNAGVLLGGESLDIRLQDWQRVIQVNLMGVIAGSLAAVGIMKAQGGGQVLNMGSLTALVLAPMLGPYSTTKSGVLSFSRGLAEEAEPWGVQVSVACPGNIRTSLLPSHISRLTPAMDPDDAALGILKRMARGDRVIVFPFYAKLWWWIERLSPRLLRPMERTIVRRARQREEAARLVCK